jgi:hypothetical protein
VTVQVLVPVQAPAVTVHATVHVTVQVLVPVQAPAVTVQATVHVTVQVLVWVLLTVLVQVKVTLLFHLYVNPIINDFYIVTVLYITNIYIKKYPYI